MIITALLLAIAVIAYLLGSVNGAIIISRFLFHSDACARSAAATPGSRTSIGTTAPRA